MRVLIDECIDERFRKSLPEHDCQTARYAGLAGPKNGELLIAAGKPADIFEKRELRNYKGDDRHRRPEPPPLSNPS